MKTIVLTFTIILMTYSDVSSQWEILNRGFNDELEDLDFVNENIGFIAGGWGSLLKTEDGGETWNTITLNQYWRLHLIDFIDECIGWALVSIDPDGRVIMKTTDGGYNWLNQKELIDISVAELIALDDNYVFMCGDYGVVLITTNGGLNWDVFWFNPLYDFYSIDFIDSSVGVVTGRYQYGEEVNGIILRTTDGCNNWNENIVSEFSGIYNLQFLSDSFGHFIATDSSGSYLCETQDTCQSWTVKTHRPFDIPSYQFLSNDTGYGIMQIDRHSISRSVDGGVNWQTVQSFEPFTLDKIYFSEVNRGFIIGSSVLITGNGEDWTVNRYEYPFKDVFFIDNNIGYLLGGTSWSWVHCSAHGELFSTSDGGLNLDVNLSIGVMLKTCHFINDQTGFALAASCGDFQIFKTIDTGNSWDIAFEHNPDSAGFYFDGKDIWYLDEFVGWSVGRFRSLTSIDSIGAAIIKTTGGGVSWALEYTILDSNNFHFDLYSIYHSDNTVWTVGESGIILKNSAESGWELQQAITDLPLNKIYFYDTNNGWIAGGYLNNNGIQHILIKTTDAGESWSEINNIDYLIIDICFYNADIGFAVGIDEAENGVFLKTADGGNNWGIITIDLMGPLNSIYLKDEYGWAVGENGQILRTTNAGATWVDDRNNKTYLSEFYLEQNYPNPFNPITTIKYQITKRSFVTIKIYDALGNEIETLVNEEQPQGIYETKFDGSEFSSGVYLYKIKTDTYSETRKMILLK